MILQKQITNLKQNPYLRNVVILMFGSGLSQLIPFAASLILARLYTAEDFGIFTLFGSVVAFLSVFGTLRYEAPIMLPRRKSTALHLVALSLGISILVSLIIIVLVLIFPSQIAILLGSPKLKPWLIFIGLSVLSISIISTLSQWVNRNKQYKTLSKLMISQSATTATTNIGLGFAGLTKGGLILGSMLGQGLIALVFLRKFIAENGRLIVKISPKRLKEVAKEYSDFPKYNFPHRLVDMISLTGLPILIAYIFTEAILGWYGFMLRVLKAPIGIMTASIGQVYFQQLSENVAQGKSAYRLFTRTVGQLAIILFPFFLIILLWGPQIFAFVFGPQWLTAGEYARLITPWLFLSSLTSPVSQTPITMGKVKANMWAGVGNNLLLVSLFFFVAKLSHSAETVFLFIGIVMPFYHAMLLYWYYRLIIHHKNKLDLHHS